MFKFIITIVIVFIISDLIPAQPRSMEFRRYQDLKLLDSIKVDESAQFVLKDNFTNWTHNFDDLSYMMVIYKNINSPSEGMHIFSDEAGGYEYDRGQYIKFTSDLATFQPKVTRGVNPGDYSIETTGSVNKLGKYYFVAVVKGKDEAGNYNESAAYWIVTCNIKMVETSIKSFNIMNQYRFGESVSFNFAVDGYNNLKEYSYRIYEGSNKQEIFAGLGSYVSLDFITNNPINVDKSFLVEGYYSGKILKYYNPQKSIIDSTSWSFKLLKPEKFEAKTKWMSQSDFNNLRSTDVVDALDMNENDSRQFKFAYYTPGDKSDLVIAPELKDVRLSCEPADFVTIISQSYKVYKEGLWQVLEITPNSVFLSNIKKDQVKKVSIEISFTTQFNEQKKLKFAAYVF
jgi:hypothetical protein